MFAFKVMLYKVLIISALVIGGTECGVKAQEITAQPSPTAESTTVVGVPPVDSTVVAPTAEKTPEPTKEPEQKSLFSTATIGELLLFLGLSGFAGGGIVAIILSFLGKKEVRDRVEDARNSWSPEQQAVLANFTTMFERTAGGILDFLKAVQDNQPNTDVVAQVLSSPQLKAGIKNGVDKAMDESVGIRD